MSNNSDNLKIILHPNLTFKLTEEGEVIICDFLLQANRYNIEIKELLFELYDDSNKTINTYTTQSAKNSLQKNVSMGLVAQINLQNNNIEFEIKKTISDFKEQVYRYAKEIEFNLNKEENIAQDNIRNVFIQIKDHYVNDLKTKIKLKYGSYKLKSYIYYSSNILGFIQRDGIAISEISFSVSNEWQNNFVKLDNFLGVILSNILFSPEQVLEIQYPQYKPIILKVRN